MAPREHFRALSLSCRRPGYVIIAQCLANHYCYWERGRCGSTVGKGMRERAPIIGHDLPKALLPQTRRKNTLAYSLDMALAMMAHVGLRQCCHELQHNLTTLFSILAYPQRLYVSSNCTVPECPVKHDVLEFQVLESTHGLGFRVVGWVS